MDSEEDMKKGKLNEWLTLLANFGVVTGIVFLVIEVRQNQAAIEESNLINRVQARSMEIDQFNDFRAFVSQSEELSRIWVEGIAGQPLDTVERARFEMLCLSNVWISVGAYERSLLLDRPGIADGTVRIRAEMLAESPGFRDCWNKVVRQSVLEYGMGEYVDAVESLANEL
jgi:hypothetical protein